MQPRVKTVSRLSLLKHFNFVQKTSFSLASLLLLSLFFSCRNEPVPPQVVTVGSLQLQQQSGTDCDRPDTSRTNCARLDLVWPTIEQGSDALKKSVNLWATRYLNGILAPSPDIKTPAISSVETAANTFFDEHRKFAEEADGSVMAGAWVAESGYRVLLNDGRYLTLEITGYTFQGGAHGSPTAAVATFDALTGIKLTWDHLVTNKTALKTLAEKKFRETRTDLFSPTDGIESFEFDATMPFELAQNYGLVEDGIYLHYLVYEVGPYAIGSTQMTIPYEELGALAKLRAQTPPPGTGGGMVPDFYEVDGDSIVIPTFEIEVSNSPKVNQMLRSRKETVIVSAMFNGEPLNTQDRDEIGMMPVLDHNIELTGNNRIARFEGLKFSRKQLGKLADKDINLLINVYSGRKSSQDNLLDCGFMEMKASGFGNKRFVLGCKLIGESGAGTTGYPQACYALLPAGYAGGTRGALLVGCDERGKIEFAGRPMKDYEALKAAIRPVLLNLIQSGEKNLPGIETQGCMSGNSGAIRDMYEDLIAELKGKTSDNSNAAAKPASAKTSVPSVALKKNGEVLLNGKKVALENLRKELQNVLLAKPVIPEKIPLKTVGQTGMGMRSEVNTSIAEAIKGAKWIRKKAAFEALNNSVSKKLRTATKLAPGTYKTNADFAFISARPLLADGGAIPYSLTDYAVEHKAAYFSDNAIGLLQYKNGKWSVLAYSIGVSKPPVEVWVKKYKAPRALFGK